MGNLNLSYFLRIPQKLLTGILSLLFLLTTTLLFLLIWIPIYIWRLFVILITSKFLSKRYGRIFSPMDVICHVQTPSGAPQSSLVCTAELGRDLTIDQVRELFSRLVLERTLHSNSNGNGEDDNDEQTPLLRYPELRQFEVDWLGFRFLKWEEDFNINDHIIEMNSTENKTLNVSEAHMNLLEREFPETKSPWELVLFRKVIIDDDKDENGQTLLGFRIHHSIADGLSILKLFVECLGGKRLVKASRSLMDRRNSSERIWHLLKSPFLLGSESFHYWKDVFISSGIKGTRLGLSKGGSSNKKRRVVVGISKKVSMQEIKGLAKRLEVTSSAVIMAGILGGYGKHVKRAGCSDKEMKRVPMGYVLPVDGHPDGFANHWSTSYGIVNLDTLRSSTARIRMCRDTFQRMKSGTKSQMLQTSIFFAGTCFTTLAGILLRNRVVSFGITNIAGEEEGFWVGGTECVDFSLSFGGLPGIGLMFCVMSYRNYFRVSCVAEESQFMSEQQVNELANLIFQEFQEFFIENGDFCV